MTGRHRVGGRVVGCAKAIKGVIDLPGQRLGVQIVEVALSSPSKKF